MVNGALRETRQRLEASFSMEPTKIQSASIARILVLFSINAYRFLLRASSSGPNAH